MTCKNISQKGQETLRDYDSVQQAVVGTGIYKRGGVFHANASSQFPTEGIKLDQMTPEMIQCFNDLTGISDNSGSAAFMADISTLRQLIDYFKEAGNMDAANVISGQEIDAYVMAYARQAGEGFDASAFRQTAATNLNSYVNLVLYLGGGDAYGVPTTEAAEPKKDAIQTYNSVRQLYVGIVAQEVDGIRVPVSEEIPEGGILVGALTEPTIKKYLESVGATIDAEGNVSASTALGKDSLQILSLVGYFKGIGNLDNGSPVTITAEEIDAYVRAYVAQEKKNGNKSITFDNFKPIVVGNLNAIVACVNEINNPTRKAADAPAAPPLPADNVVKTTPTLGEKIAWGVGALVVLGATLFLGKKAAQAIRGHLVTYASKHPQDVKRGKYSPRGYIVRNFGEAIESKPTQSVEIMPADTKFASGEKARVMVTKHVANHLKLFTDEAEKILAEGGDPSTLENGGISSNYAKYVDVIVDRCFRKVSDRYKVANSVEGEAPVAIPLGSVPDVDFFDDRIIDEVVNETVQEAEEQSKVVDSMRKRGEELRKAEAKGAREANERSGVFSRFRRGG